MKLQSLQQPHAIIMVGTPGSGKTQFAQKFSEMFEAPFINLAYIAQRASTPEAAAELAYTQLTELLKTKSTIVLELSTDTRTRRTEIAKIVKQAGFNPLFVWVQVDEQTAKQRTLKAKTLAPEEFEAQIKQFSAPHQTERALVISGKHTYGAQARAVLRRLTEPRAAAAKEQRPSARPARSGQQVRIQ